MTLAVALTLGPATAPAMARDCHGKWATKLFLKHGISGVEANRGITCGRTVRVLRRWSHNGKRGKGPRGWRCTSERLNRDARRVECERRRKAMQFDVGTI